MTNDYVIKVNPMEDRPLYASIVKNSVAAATTAILFFGPHVDTLNMRLAKTMHVQNIEAVIFKDEDQIEAAVNPIRSPVPLSPKAKEINYTGLPVSYDQATFLKSKFQKDYANLNNIKRYANTTHSRSQYF
jgi:hypothetical protein